MGPTWDVSGDTRLPFSTGERPGNYTHTPVVPAPAVRPLTLFTRTGPLFPTVRRGRHDSSGVSVKNPDRRGPRNRGRGPGPLRGGLTPYFSVLPYIRQDSRVRVLTPKPQEVRRSLSRTGGPDTVHLGDTGNEDVPITILPPTGLVSGAGERPTDPLSSRSSTPAPIWVLEGDEGPTDPLSSWGPTRTLHLGPRSVLGGRARPGYRPDRARSGLASRDPGLNLHKIEKVAEKKESCPRIYFDVRFKHLKVSESSKPRASLRNKGFESESKLDLRL